MTRKTFARRPLAATAAVLLASLGVLGAAPAAFADGSGTSPGTTQTATTPGQAPAGAQDSPSTELTVDAPAAVGFAGQPVEFTETVRNTGAQPDALTLDLLAHTGAGAPPNALSLDYLTDKGAWKAISLAFSGEEFEGRMSDAVQLAPGAARTVHFRIGVPMGSPHNGDSNGGFPSIKLTSTALAADSSGTKRAQDIHTIKVTPISSRLTGVPASATAGGKPVKFDAVLSNPTPSAYVNVNHVLFTNRHATVQALVGGHWASMPSAAGDNGSIGYYIGGHDIAAAPGSTTTTPIRVSYDAETPAGPQTLRTCLIVNEGHGNIPFRGTTMCSTGATLKIAPATVTSPTHSPTATPTATPTSTPTTGSSAAPQLAETGTGSSVGIAASLAAGLLIAGAGAAAFSRSRRSS